MGTVLSAGKGERGCLHFQPAITTSTTKRKGAGCATIDGRAAQTRGGRYTKKTGTLGLDWTGPGWNERLFTHELLLSLCSGCRFCWVLSSFVFFSLVLFSRSLSIIYSILFYLLIDVPSMAFSITFPILCICFLCHLQRGDGIVYKIQDSIRY